MAGSPENGVSLGDLRTLICDAMGLGTDYTALSTTDSARVDSAIRFGLLGFWGAFDWPFLHPVSDFVLFCDSSAARTGGTTTLIADSAVFYPSMVGHIVTFDTSGNEYRITEYISSTEVGVDSSCSGEGTDSFSIEADGEYTLPDDFAGLDAPVLRYKDGSFNSVEVRPIDAVLERRQSLQAYGAPCMAAVAPMSAAILDDKQRYVLHVWPIPSSTVTLKLPYRIVPMIPGDAADIIPGGPMFGRASIAACLAYAERLFEGQPGPHEAAYQEELKKAIAAAQELNPRIHGVPDEIDAYPYRVVTGVTYEGTV